MNKYLLLFGFAISMMGADAQKIKINSINERPLENANIRLTAVDNPRSSEEAPRIASHAPAKANQALVTPEGTMKYYTLNAVVRDLSGLMPVLNVAEKIYFADDDKTLYFGSLFPSVLRCEDLWVKGTLSGNTVTIDCYEEVVRIDEVDNEGNLISSDYAHVGELLVDAKGQPYGLDDVKFTRDGDRYYIDYTDVDLRPIILFTVDSDETITVVTTAYNHDLRPYTGNTTLMTPPATAEVKEYIYSGQDAYANDFAIRGEVAVDGNDYYFDSLLPEAGKAWIKGKRSGNTITLENDQFLGTEISYYLYYNGFKMTGFDNSTGQYTGDKTKLTFKVDDKGIITLSDPNRTFPCAFFSSGNQFTSTFQNRIEPFGGDAVAYPSDPYDLKLVTKYFEKYGENSISYVYNNISSDGSYINPELLYSCMYLDEDVFTFVKDTAHDHYAYIDGNEMTYIPYGYRDAGNYDIYQADDGRNVICFFEDMFTQIGIQVVYRLDGKDYCSNIVYVDDFGNIEVVPPSAVKGIPVVSADNATWYALCGRSTTVQQPGKVYIKNGSKIIKR